MSLDAQIVEISNCIDRLQADGKMAPGDHSRLQVMLIRLRNGVEELTQENRTNYAHGQGYY